MDESKCKISAIPSGYMMDLKHIIDFEDPKQNRTVRMWYDKKLFTLEADNIILATYPKGARLEESIIVHPRYANKEHFELIEVKGFRNGRTIDILLPNHKLINVKGTGAFADGEHMIIDTERWYHPKTKSWKPFNEVMDASLGRRWGLLDQYAGEKEFKSNLLKDLNIPQIPHLKLNYMPDGILPFKGVTQLVRELDTNIRCDSDFLLCGQMQKEYIWCQNFSEIDANIFKVQKELFKDNKVLTLIGRIPQNRYIDGKFTDMENYFIKQETDSDKVVRIASNFSYGLIGSAFIAMCMNEDGRKKYLKGLGEKTSLDLSKYNDINPEIFTGYLNANRKDENLNAESDKFFNQLRKDMDTYLRN